MIKVYPAIFHKENNSYWVEFPGLEGCNTCGSRLDETMELAQEALGLYLVSLLEDKKPLPDASELSLVPVPTDGFTTYVTTDIDRYRRNTKAVKKTLSIPQWLSDEAEKHNLSLSRVLQEGLRDRLGV